MTEGFHSVIVKDGVLVLTSRRPFLLHPKEMSIIIYQPTRRDIVYTICVSLVIIKYDLQ